jgi:hypothetical protein
MSLVYQIPKTSHFISTSNTFTATFNVPTIGLYDFAVAGNVGQVVIPLNLNSVYLLNRITIGGTIPQEEYLFNIVTLPLLRLRYLKENQSIYRSPIPVVQFIDGMEAVAWLWTEQSRDSLIMDLDIGQLSQDAFLVGVATVRINVCLTIFECFDNGFVQEFKKSNSNSRIGAQSNLSSEVRIVV